MATTDIELDEELLALLHEQGIDPEWVKAQQVEMAKFKRSPDEEAKLEAERAELRESTEAQNKLWAERGTLAEHARNYARNRS